MKKLKLNVDSLSVNSFQTGALQSGGTVVGQSDTEIGCVGITILVCIPVTMVNSWIGECPPAPAPPPVGSGGGGGGGW